MNIEKVTVTYAIECKIGASARNLTELYMKYSKGVPQLARRFGANKKTQDQALLGLEAFGA
jgi:hypothetical protein